MLNIEYGPNSTIGLHKCYVGVVSMYLIFFKSVQRTCDMTKGQDINLNLGQCLVVIDHSRRSEAMTTINLHPFFLIPLGHNDISTMDLNKDVVLITTTNIKKEMIENRSSSTRPYSFFFVTTYLDSLVTNSR